MIGPVNGAAETQQSVADARRIATRIVRRGPIAIGRARVAINRALEAGLNMGLCSESEAVTLTFDPEDWDVGITAWPERRKPGFEEP